MCISGSCGSRGFLGFLGPRGSRGFLGFLGSRVPRGSRGSRGPRGSLSSSGSLGSTFLFSFPVQAEVKSPMVRAHIPSPAVFLFSQRFIVSNGLINS